MTSREDRTIGAQLVREFTLDASSSRLACTQTIKNVSAKTVAWHHWGRTFAVGGGICLVPLTPGNRFPNHYLMYGPGPVMNYRPEDPNIRVRDGFLEVLGAPARAKLGIDSYAGWFCYLTTSDLMCEFEPIGPRETLAPGQSASFTEEWWLLPYAFPEKGTDVNLEEVTDLVQRQWKN